MKKTILFAISIYQLLSPFRGHCRYYPTCSQYAKESIKKYGVTKGGLLALMRLLSCHPFAKVRSDKLEVRSYL